MEGTSLKVVTDVVGNGDGFFYDFVANREFLSPKTGNCAGRRQVQKDVTHDLVHPWLTSSRDSCETCVMSSADDCKRTIAPGPSITAEDEPFRMVYTCLYCDMHFESEAAGMSHMAKHEQANFEIYGVPALHTYRCKDCDGMFLGMSALVTHKKVCDEEKRFQCCVCKKKFRYKTKLCHHESQCKLTCVLCKERYNCLCKFAHHMKSSHSGTIVLFCPICEAAFDSAVKMYLHLVTHGKRSYKCRSCRQEFTNRVSMDRHEKIHEPRNVSELRKVVMMDHGYYRKNPSRYFETARRRKSEVRAFMSDVARMDALTGGPSGSLIGELENAADYQSRHWRDCLGQVSVYCHNNLEREQFAMLNGDYENCIADILIEERDETTSEIDVGDHFKCFVCDRYFRSKKRVLRHLEKHRKESDKENVVLENGVMENGLMENGVMENDYCDDSDDCYIVEPGDLIG